MATILQGLFYQQPAEAVHGRIDAKDSLGIELAGTAFDFSVLIEYRSYVLPKSTEIVSMEQ
ncbi:MAG: hypothetical protein WA996_25340 [Candidatus Promineifilaceae bacterium]